MTALVTERFRDLAGTLAELKVRVRTALATELAGAVGTAVRDVLVGAMVDRIIAMPSRTPARPQLSHPGGSRAEEYERRDGRDTAHDPWSDDDDDRGERAPSRYDSDRDEVVPVPAIPAAAAVAVGIRAGRWWLARHGTVSAAVGVGALATALGFAGGPLARAALAIVAAATDLLTAESFLARLDHS